jgi:hypothetical protein
MNQATALREKLHLASQQSDTPEIWRVRLHRAISWLARAEREADDPDARFIFQWIALNAAYASEFGRAESERERARRFIDTLVSLDAERRLHHALFTQFSGPIRTLLDNKFVFEPFWTALREHDASNVWETSFANSRKLALAATVQGDTATLLSVVFDRLYVLRNQLVHGGATWNSKVNRAQVRDGAAILGTLVPLVMAIMLEHPEQGFGDVLYPVV